MDLREYLKKYFKFNRNSQRQFVYTFFPTLYSSCETLKLENLTKFLFKTSAEYFEYFFDKDLITDFKTLKLDEDKCIISKDFDVGLFYDSFKKEICFYNFRKFENESDIFNFEGNSELGTKIIHDKTSNEIKRFYEPLIKNPTQDFEDVLNRGFYHVIRDYGVTRCMIEHTTPEEKEVLVDIYLDLSAESFLDLAYLFPQEKVTNYLLKMYKSKHLEREIEPGVYFNLCLRKREMVDLDTMMKYVKYYPIHPLVFEIIRDFDYTIFIKFIVELLHNSYYLVRDAAYSLLCKRNTSINNNTIKNKLDCNLNKEIRRILLFKSEEYDDFIKELTEDKVIDNSRLTYLLSKYKPSKDKATPLNDSLN